MRAVLHQLLSQTACAAALARCKSGDAVLLAGPAASLADRTQWPAGTELFVLKSDLEQTATIAARAVKVIDDADWVALCARFPTIVCW